jgi:hypothetical protein
MKLIAHSITLLIAFITPIMGLGYMMIGAVLLDTIYAIYVTIKKDGIKTYRSGKLFNIVPKLFLYLGSVLLSYSFSVYIIGTDLFGIKDLLPKLITSLFIYIEVKSIDETYVKMHGTSLSKIAISIVGKLKNLKKDINDVIN